MSTRTIAALAALAFSLPLSAFGMGKFPEEAAPVCKEGVPSTFFVAGTLEGRGIAIRAMVFKSEIEPLRTKYWTGNEVDELWVAETPSSWLGIGPKPKRIYHLIWFKDGCLAGESDVDADDFDREYPTKNPAPVRPKRIGGETAVAARFK